MSYTATRSGAVVTLVLTSALISLAQIDSLKAQRVSLPASAVKVLDSTGKLMSAAVSEWTFAVPLATATSIVGAEPVEGASSGSLGPTFAIPAGIEAFLGTSTKTIINDGGVYVAAPSLIDAMITGVVPSQLASYIGVRVVAPRLFTGLSRIAYFAGLAIRVIGLVFIGMYGFQFARSFWTRTLAPWVASLSKGVSRTIALAK